LSGDYPFERNNAEKPLAIQILSGSYQVRAGSWHLVSSMAVNLVKKMLIVCPKQRIPLADIFKHPWLQVNCN
jgi:serine/threonine protein kinase